MNAIKKLKYVFQYGSDSMEERNIELTFMLSRQRRATQARRSISVSLSKSFALAMRQEKISLTLGAILDGFHRSATFV